MESKKFLDLTKDLVLKGHKSGADLIEAYLINSKDLSINVSNTQVETMKVAEECGLGLRVFKEGRMGFAYSSDLAVPSLERMLEQALANAQKTTPDEGNTLAKPEGSYEKLDLFDPRIAEVSVEEKIELAKTIERSARERDPRVKITEHASYSESAYEVFIANSLGIEASYRGNYCGASAWLVAEENGDNQTGFGMDYTLKYENLNPKAIGEEAADKAVRMLGAKGIPTTRGVVVLDPYIATNFLGILASAFSAEAVQKGKSLFAGKVGQGVGAKEISIIDHGNMPGGIMSAPFDGEGYPTSKTILVEGGILQGYLHNTYTAAKEGTKSTGNGTRSSFKSTPEIGTTNFYIAKGPMTRDELLKGVQKGLYITDVMGMHTANPISGDFSLGASGLWIENGEFTKPVRGVAIAGNLIDLLRSVEGVADDLRWFGGRGAPTLRISQMTISGH